MVYKKYLKKGSKVFGPYYYSSYRHDGKVKKIYIGREKEYKIWLKNKKKFKKKLEKEKAVKQKDNKKFKSSSKFGEFLFFVTVLFLFSFIFLHYINFSEILGNKISFTGFVVSENMTSLEQSNSLYGNYQEEVLVESFDTEQIDLEIKEPSKFAGEPITKNKNKRMDFETSETPIRLYFDLLNYSEFVEGVEGVIVQEKVGKLEEELTAGLLSSDERDSEDEMASSESQVVEGEEEEEGLLLNQTEEIGLKINETEKEAECGNGILEEGEECDDGNIEKGDGCSAKCKIKKNKKKELELNETEEEDEGMIEEENEGVVEEEDEEVVKEESVVEEKEKKDKVTGKVSKEQDEEESVEKSESTITGNIIRGLTGFVVRIVGFAIEDEIENSIVDEAVVQEIIENITLRDVQDKVEELNDKEIEIINDEAVINAEEFEVIVNETVLNKTKDISPEYKWGYKVKLNDLSFMAKIDITVNSNISKYNDNSLKIGENQLLSFQDLADAGYTISIGKPSVKILTEKEKKKEKKEKEEEINKTNEKLVDKKKEKKEKEEEINKTNEKLVDKKKEKVIENISGEEVEQVEEVEQEPTITGNIIRRFADFTGLAIETTNVGVKTEVKDVEYEYSVSVYIEKDFNEYNELIVNSKQTIGEPPQTASVTGNVVEENIRITDSQINNSSEANNSSTQPLVLEDNEIINKTNNIQTSENSLSESKAIDSQVSIEEELIINNFMSEIDYEDVDMDGKVSVGDVIFLDPTLKLINITDVTTGDLTNITAETNFTHLTTSDDYLVLYLPFDGDLENTATTTHYDFTPFDNDGTGYGNAVVNETGCLYGDCLQLDGDGDYVSVPLTESLNTTSDKNWTISFWMKPNVADDVYDNHILGNFEVNWYPSNNNWGGFRFRQYHTTLYFYDYNDSSSNLYSRKTSFLVAGTWYHVVGTYNSTHTTLYVNGVRADSDAIVSGGVGSTSEPWYLGTAYVVGGAKEKFWNGTLDEIMIFNKSLTPAEVSDIYNNQSKRFKTSGLQSFGDQSVFNITTGYNQVQVVGSVDYLMGSEINLSIGQYYDSTWTYTAEQVFDGDNIFTIDSSTTNLTLNFTFYAGNITNPFYSPILSSDISALQVNLSDTTAPTIIIDYPANNSNINASSVEFNISSSDLSWCGISISGNANQTMTINSSSSGANYTNTSIADGSYTFIVSCNDTANNYASSGNYSFLIDTVIPVPLFVFDSPRNNGAINKTSTQLNVSVSDANTPTYGFYDDSLVLWMTMDDVNSSGDVVDISGQGNDGVAVANAVQTTDGRFGKGFEFDGAGVLKL